MDTANPYQVHDSTVKLVILALDRDEGKLPTSVAAGDSTTGKMRLRQKYFCVHDPYRDVRVLQGRDELTAQRQTH
jgi:hypothetical protein